MLVHFTLIKVMPEKVQEAADILAGSKLLEYFLKTKGLQHGSLSQSVEEPGKLLSLSMWQSMADAQTAFTDPNYAALVGELRSLLIAPPVRIAHNVLHSHVNRALPADQPLFVHNTIVTVAPENTQKLLGVLYSEKIIALLKTIDPFIMSYACESYDEPGRIVSMSWWRSAVGARETFSHPEYVSLVGELSHLFIKAPERQAYNLLKIVRHD